LDPRATVVPPVPPGLPNVTAAMTTTDFSPGKTPALAAEVQHDIRVPSNSESAVKRNHETPKSGIPKRKKTEACPRLSWKIEYLLASNHRDQSTASEYFTDD
jgi:hypothetical protein